MVNKMTKILRKAYVKFGVQKTNRIFVGIVSGLAVMNLLAAMGTAAYSAGYINGKQDIQDITDWLLTH